MGRVLGQQASANQSNSRFASGSIYLQRTLLLLHAEFYSRVTTIASGLLQAAPSARAAESIQLPVAKTSDNQKYVSRGIVGIVVTGVVGRIVVLCRRNKTTLMLSLSFEFWTIFCIAEAGPYVDRAICLFGAQVLRV
ncbi:uncharacterized protein LOC132303089 isoform X2 [Cornus florida]|uniref:uncharacterized protein LOC132303089 isoform X2 n=1 Tax=Cornus florida TaxID=4283 RepID=UPI0028975CC5|nr:uncharacterized protein LOC132303089 isoform X2 [Cornus florida]